MEPVLKNEEAHLLTDAILEKLARDLPLESITNATDSRPKPLAWIGKVAATLILMILSITAIQQSNQEYTSTIDWNPQMTKPLAETTEQQSTQESEIQREKSRKTSTHPEIMVGHLEYDQPIKDGPVVFEAGESITLKPGFKVEAGVTFTAAIINHQRLILE